MRTKEADGTICTPCSKRRRQMRAQSTFVPARDLVPTYRRQSRGRRKLVLGGHPCFSAAQVKGDCERHMLCRMTARFRATATRAFFIPLRRATRGPSSSAQTILRHGRGAWSPPRIVVAEHTARDVEICGLKLNDLFAAARPDPDPHDFVRLHRGIQKLSKRRRWVERHDLDGELASEPKDAGKYLGRHRRLVSATRVGWRASILPHQQIST